MTSLQDRGATAPALDPAESRHLHSVSGVASVSRDDGAMMQVRYGDLVVSYRSVLDGGGMTFGQLYMDFLRRRVGRVKHAFEYCAGPGFIGFSLLAHGLCEQLTLADINPIAVEACERTIRDNRLQDRVRVFLSDGLNGIPSTERWDLVVGNPPHWCGKGTRWERDLRLVDPDFIVHRQLYSRVAEFLAPGGRVILQENGLATRATDFDAMIASGGLRRVDVYPEHAARPRLLHEWRSRTVLFAECILNAAPVEALFKQGQFFRPRRERARTRLDPYYFIVSERPST